MSTTSALRRWRFRFAVFFSSYGSKALFLTILPLPVTLNLSAQRWVFIFGIYVSPFSLGRCRWYLVLFGS